MSEPTHTMDATGLPRGWNEERLHAYFDGELSGFARWRFERQLRRSPDLQRELEVLAEIGDRVRESQPDPAGPGVWDAIALRLPAEDAGRADAGIEVRGGLHWLALPAGAVAVAAALIAALTLGWPVAEPGSGGVVRWLDSGGRSVMVLDDAPGTTIIWVLDNRVDGAATGGGGREMA